MDAFLDTHADLDVLSRQELANIRKDMLRMYSLALLLAAWGWYAVAAAHQDLTLSQARVVLVTMGGLGLSHFFGKRSHALAAITLLATTLAFYAQLVYSYPEPLVVAMGSLILIIARGLLGESATTVVALVSAAVGLGIWRAGQPDLPFQQTLLTLLLFAGSWIVNWLAARPLTTSVTWALTGWARAQQMLKEVQKRRAELYRALRALEEATYRIERMNQELIVARQEAEIARAQKARFAATVSHELRGPLSLILGFSRLIMLSPERYGEPLPSAYYADISAIYHNTQHLASLVDDVLDLSQIEAKRLPLVKDRIDVKSDVIEKATEIVRPLVERKGLALYTDLPEKLPWVMGDAVRLRQVLIGLLTNAIRFTDAGHIAITAKSQEDCIQISVADTGAGIAEKDLPKLFQEFSQVHRSDPKIGGSGLGLSIAKELVELHGGQIWAESKLGQGTTFHFTLPLPGRKRLVSELIRQDIPHRSQAYLTCLVVHDDPAVVRLLARYIEGYRIVSIPTSEEALSLIYDLHPRAVIGSQAALSQIQQALASSPIDVPLITCTLPRVTDQKRFKGVIAYLIKPITPEMLESVLRRLEREGELDILIVDDDPDAARLIESLLTLLPHPYRIRKAYSGIQALTEMQRQPPDVILLDLLMPEMSGEELLAQMRQDPRLRDVSTILISARDWTEEPATIAMPISVACKRKIAFGEVARCLKGILDNIRPMYLPEAEPVPTP